MAGCEVARRTVFTAGPPAQGMGRVRAERAERCRCRTTAICYV